MQQQPIQAEQKQPSQAIQQLSTQAEEQQPSQVGHQEPRQDESVGRRIEKVEKLNKKIREEQEKIRKNLDVRKQERNDLKEKQTLEEFTLNKKNNKEEASLKKRHINEEEVTLKKRQKEEEITLKKKITEEKSTLDKKHNEEEAVLEMAIKRDNELQQRHIALMKECRDELAQDLQIQIYPTQDTSEDRVKLEAAESSLECPICMELMRPPTRIWMCRRTHVICETCKEALDEKEQSGKGKCPTCVTQRITERAFVVENIARNIFN